jgi:hypothetical protein
MDSDCPRVLVTGEAFALVVQPEQAPATLVALGGQGEPGPPGPPGGGSGVSYVQDSAPLNPLEQETWFNPLTLQLKVFTSAAWRPVSPDGGHF